MYFVVPNFSVSVLLRKNGNVMCKEPLTISVNDGKKTRISLFSNPRLD